MIPQQTVELILDSARIEDVIGDFLTLKRRGASFVACCPFHNEKTPSFYVTPSKGLYKCFGCGKAGSAVGFVMEHEHISYVEALRHLAKKYNIDIVEEEQSAEEIALKQRKESLLIVSEFAQKFYASQLHTGEGRAVGYGYFRKRALDDETIRKFGLGWAPSGKTALLDAAVAAGYKVDYLLDAGLAVRREDGTVVDKFRERVMFPIHSVSGRVIAFSGRTLRLDNNAKYVNSPETEIYVKSKILLGIYFAKSDISRLGKCILVEGNVDMVMMHQLGIRNVVASCGTSLTVEQIRLIHKFTEDITIMYDGDPAGIHAALRGIDLILAEGLNVRTVLLPDGEDPDSFARSHTLEEVLSFIKNGEKDFITFKTELLLSDAGGDPLKKAALINDIADSIAAIPDPVKRSVYIESISVRFGIESAILFDRVGRDRKKIKEDEARTLERYQSVRGEDSVRNGSSVPVQDISLIPENRTLAPSEEDLLYLLLTHGCDELEFESDSEYYAGDGISRETVASFISEALSSDGSVMANTAYRLTYDAYFELFGTGLSQEDILLKLLNSQDRTVADTAARISTEKYRLTVQAFEASLTTTASWLVSVVPKSIMIYNERRIQDSLDKLKTELKTADSESQTSIMQKMVKLQAAQRRINQIVGREKTIK